MAQTDEFISSLNENSVIWSSDKWWLLLQEFAKIFTFDWHCDSPRNIVIIERLTHFWQATNTHFFLSLSTEYDANRKTPIALNWNSHTRFENALCKSQNNVAVKIITQKNISFVFFMCVDAAEIETDLLFLERIYEYFILI